MPNQPTAADHAIAAQHERTARYLARKPIGQFERGLLTVNELATALYHLNVSEEVAFQNYSDSADFFDPCPWCDAAWDGIMRTHNPDCPFWKWIIRPEPED